MLSRKKEIKEAIVRIIFAVWIALWGWFFVRELFVKNNIRDYRALLFRTLEGKHAYVTGDKLYVFLVQCDNEMPSGATYQLTGIEEGALERRKAVYYLYPHLEAKEPDFIIDAAQYTVKKARQ